MTNATMKTGDELQEELADARRRHQDALAEAGFARIGGSVAAKTTKAVTESRVEVEELEAALDAFDQVEADQRATAERQAASDARIDAFRWALDYLPLLDQLAEAVEVLEGVERRVRDAFAECPRRRLLETRRERFIDPQHGRRDRDLSETDVAELIHVPVPVGTSRPRDFTWSIDRGHALTELFTGLIDAEREAASA
jgi:hypothetical protein